MNILIEKALFPRLRVSIALCSILYALCSLVVSAQEVEVGVKVDTAGEEAAYEVMDTDDSKKPDVDEDRPARGDRAGRSQRFQQDGQARQRPGGMRSPAVRKLMEEEGISAADLRDPEIREKFREKVEQLRRESPEDFQQDGDGARESQRQFGEPPGDFRPGGDRAPGAQRMRRGQRGTPVDEGMRPYMVVVEKNLFLQLGSGGQEERSSFALTAVVSGSDTKAIIEKRGGEESYYVSEGDTFADEIEVLDIEDQVVKLDRSGAEETLRLGEGTEGNRRRGGGRRGGRNSGASEGGGERPSGGEDRGSDDNPRQSGQGGFDPSRLPEPIQRMMRERGISMDQLRNNPELQNRLRGEFQRRAMQAGGGGRPTQGFRPQGRSQGGDRRQRR